MLHKFSLKIEDGPDTRWLIDDERLLGRLAGACGGVVACEHVTQGTMPAVTVIREENRNPIDERVRQ